MSQRVQENLIAGALLLIFASYTFLCLEFGPNARLVPLPIAILGCILVLTQLLKLNISSIRRRTSEAAAGPPDPVSTGATMQSPATKPTGRSQRELHAFGCVVGFVLLIALLGPVVAVFLFSSGYLFFTRHATRGKALLAGGVFTAIIYLLFVVGLQLQLYNGILEPLIGRY